MGCKQTKNFSVKNVWISTFEVMRYFSYEGFVMACRLKSFTLWVNGTLETGWNSLACKQRFKSGQFALPGMSRRSKNIFQYWIKNDKSVILMAFAKLNLDHW